MRFGKFTVKQLLFRIPVLQIAIYKNGGSF